MNIHQGIESIVPGSVTTLANARWWTLMKIKNEIAYVPEDRLTQGLFMDRSIQDNTIVMNRLLSKLDSDELADVGSDSI